MGQDQKEDEMSGRQLVMRVVVTVAGLVSALWILVGCQPVPPESPTSTPVPTPVPIATSGALAITPVPIATSVAPTITPVPIATWVAEGIPADTRLYYLYENDFLERCSKEEIWIIADGSATYESCDVKYAGQLSAEALKRVLLAFEEYGFFALGVDSNGCVIDMTQPPAPSATLVEKTDAGYSVTIAQPDPRCFLSSENRTLPIGNQE
jgi:hypothetical protein